MKKIINPHSVFLALERSKRTIRITPRLKVRDNKTKEYIKELGGKLDFYIWGENDIPNLTKAEMERGKLQMFLNENGYTPDDGSPKDFVSFIWEVAKEKSKGTSGTYIGAGKKFVEYLGSSSLPFNKAKEKVFAGFRQWLLNKCKKQNTASNIFTNIMAVERIAERRRYITEPVIVKRIPLVKSLKDYLNLDEIEILARTYCQDEEVKRAFLFICFSGPRTSDIKVMTGKNITYENSEHVLRYITIKTHVLVNNHLNPIVAQFLPQSMGNNTLLFPAISKYTQNELNKMLGKWVKRAGIDKHITMHCGRVTYGVMIMEDTGNLKAVMQALGQKSILSAEWAYGHLKPKSERNATKLNGLNVPVIKMINKPSDESDNIPKAA